MGGPFDSFAPGLAQTLVNTFVPGKKSWRRETRAGYDPKTGTDPAVVTTGQFATGVPVPYTTMPANGTSVLEGDLAIFVPALNISQSGFDPFPEDGATITVVIDSVTYTVISYTTAKSGDDTAGYEFQIRA